MIDPRVPGQVLVPSVSEWIVKGGIEITKEFIGNRKVMADAYYQFLSGPPLYAGSNPDALFGPDYDMYNFKIVYEEPAWSAFVSAKLQARPLAADYYGTTGSQLNFDPKPLWDVNAGLTYRFW